MPHVKLSGKLDLKELWSHAPALRFSVPEDDLHVKYQEAFLGAGRPVVLLRYVVSEGRLTQYVQVVVAAQDEGWIVKLDRTYPILRTPGVKLLVAAVAAWLERRGLAQASSTVQPMHVRGLFFADHCAGMESDPDPAPARGEAGDEG